MTRFARNLRKIATIPPPTVRKTNNCVAIYQHQLSQAVGFNRLVDCAVRARARPRDHFYPRMIDAVRASDAQPHGMDGQR